MGKQSTIAAIDRYLEKHEPQSKREPRKKNKKPEKDTEAAVLLWCRANRFHVHVVDSSSYDSQVGRKVTAKADPGFPDIVGNTTGGLAVWIELKAKDRRYNLSEIQRVFLTAKIEQHCFAVVVDDAKKLEQYWKGFSSLKTPELRKAYLLDCLPKKMRSRGNKRDRYKDEMGF